MNNHNYLINPFYQFVTPAENLVERARALFSRPGTPASPSIQFQSTISAGPRTDISPDLLAEKPWLRYYPPKMPLDIKAGSETLPGVLRDSARRFPAHTAIIFYGHKISYKE